MNWLTTATKFIGLPLATILALPASDVAASKMQITERSPLVEVPRLADANGDGISGENRCAALIHTPIAGASLRSATAVSASGDLPAHCLVRGTVKSEINFELELPLRDWNGKFYMAGCGGFCGTMNSPSDNDTRSTGLRRNYAVIFTDTGHLGKTPLDASWAVGNPGAITDFAYRAVTETARMGKKLTELYYRRAIRLSYFNGCSNGGRQALMEATRFPEDFDGIIAGAPAFDIAGLNAFLAGLSKADIGPDHLPIFNPAKIGLLSRAVAKQCGDSDGLVSSPMSCHFDPAVLQCTAGAAPTCLTDAEVGVIRHWYQAPRLKNGTLLYPGGLAYGSEPFWAPPAPGLPVLAASKMIEQATLESFSPELPKGMTFAQFDPETQTTLLGETLRGATPTSDLKRFASRGGKLLIYHGWADQILPPTRTISYYEDARRSGGAKTDKAVRLFMVPGLAHCANPPGIDAPGFDHDSFDPLTALEGWVERRVAPDAMIATKYGKDRAPLFSRPVCAFPATYGYRGKGDRSIAASWQCRIASAPLARQQKRG